MIIQDIDFDYLRQHLHDDSYNADWWGHLVSYADESADAEQSFEIYEAALERFPHTATIQIAHLRRVVSLGRLDQAETLFRSYLKQSPSVELCTFYIAYIREHHSVDPSIFIDAYKFVLRLVGHDRESCRLWSEYLALLQEDTSAMGLEKFQKALHEVVRIPLPHLPEFWSRLEKFEYKLHRPNAKKVLKQLLPAYRRARTVLRALDRHTEPLKDPPERALFLPDKLSSSSVDRQLVDKWKSYLLWEESDPLMLKGSDATAFGMRVRSAYRKATTRMKFHPEIWYMAFHWYMRAGNVDEALSQLCNGVKANKRSLLLNFALADALETRGSYTQVHEFFEQLLSSLRSTLLSNPDPTLRDDFGAVYITYMHFAQRAEGLQSARSVFRKARRDALYITWPVYEAAAMMEYHRGEGKDVALRIFQAGMKLFQGNPEYILCYLEWLISINDLNNAQSLFEASIDHLPAEHCKQLWDRWSCYIYHCGSLQAIQELVRRIMQLYPTGSPTKHLARRFSYANIDPIANRDLGVAAVTKQTSTAINQNFIPQAATPDEDPRNEHHLSDCRRSVASALGSLSDSERNPNSPVVAPGEDSRSEQPMTLGGRKRSAPDQLDYDRKLKRIMGNFTNSDGNREAQKPTKEQKFTIPATLRSLLENLPDRNTYSGPVIDANEMLTVLKTMSFSKSITGGI